MSRGLTYHKTTLYYYKNTLFPTVYTGSLPRAARSVSCLASYQSTSHRRAPPACGRVTRVPRSACSGRRGGSHATYRRGELHTAHIRPGQPIPDTAQLQMIDDGLRVRAEDTHKAVRRK